MTPDVHDAGVELLPDASRVIARLFLPGEGFTRTGSRAGDIMDRVEALSAEQLHVAAENILSSFGTRHEDLAALLRRHAEMVAFRAGESPPMDPDHEIVLGATFTAEHALEAAALCNPSAMPHPDQSGLQPGQLRLAIALRAIGEGHVSSIAFATAVVGPGVVRSGSVGSGSVGPDWTFEPRPMPLVAETVTEGDWTRAHFRESLETEARLNEVSGAIVRALPAVFRSGQIEAAINRVPAELGQRRDTRNDLDVIRTMAWSAYHASFEETSELGQRVLLPAASDETNGMEDARFVLFTHDDGRTEYRATYTAYNGRSIASRLIVSPDLREFAVHRLTGAAARNKGMALFPRRIGGRMFALTRTDGENISIARSTNGLSWTDQAVLHRPDRLWEIVQTGNCGSPIETPEGWLVLLHGVGPMRQYSIGALLLDLDDPTIVRARLPEPLLQPLDGEREGYVPNVVYSCGAVVHEGTLWLPYGIGDQRIRVASVRVAELLAAMVPEPAAGPNSRVRIAMLSSVAWRTPPRDYGPWERVASLLTEGLVARGEDVTLFATADSVTSARLESVLPRGYAEDPNVDGRVWEALHIGHALERSGDFDIVHNQIDWLPLAFAGSWAAPLVTTIHGFSGPAILPAYARAASNYVSISDADRSPELSYLATVHHGIDLAEFTATTSTPDDLVVLGRIHPDKGTADAIEIARRTGRRLWICGPVVDEAYFAERVAPHIDGERVIHLGSIGPAERDRVLGAAAVLLHPIQFDEPFGLAVVEAMACGTPVVAYRRGSMPEIIDDGVTGFVVAGINEAVAAVPRAAALDRARVRAVAARRFGVDRMVDEYLGIYHRLVDG